MPAALAFIDENPKEAQSESRPRNDGGRETNQRLFPVDRLLLVRQYFKFPGAQSQGLAAVCPEPTVKYKTDKDQVDGVKKII